MTDGSLGRRTYLGYALGSVGTAGFSTVPGLLLAYYLTNSLGVPAALSAMVVLIPKLWDVAFLPYVGTISDRSAQRRGTRRPLLLIGGLSLPIVFVLMFSAPTGGTTALAAAWVLVFFLLSASAFALFQVPYIAMPAEITDSVDERTTMMSWRVAFLAFGILAFGVGAPAVRDAASDGSAPYTIMAVGVASLIAIGMIGCWWLLRRTRPVPHSTAEATSHSLRAQFVVAWRTRAFRLLLSAFVVQALATGAMLAGAQYFATYVLGDQSMSDVLFAALIVPALVVMPLWARIAHRRGKRHGYLLSSLVFLAGALLLLTLAMGSDRRGAGHGRRLRGRLRRDADVPARTASRHDRRRHGRHRAPAGRILHRGLDGRRDTRLRHRTGTGAAPPRRDGLHRLVGRGNRPARVRQGRGPARLHPPARGARRREPADHPPLPGGRRRSGGCRRRHPSRWRYVMSLPRHGRSAEQVHQEAEAMRVHDAPVHGGRVLAYVYDSGVPGLDAAGREALAGFGEVNALDPTVFPSVGRIENDLVGWGLGLLGGGEGGCGVVTSGGTESCILAVLAAREEWRARGGRGEPTIVMPVTAHAAFVKAAHLLAMRVRTVPVDPQSMRVRPSDIAAALDEEGAAVALVVASAPSYAHGVVDPIPEIARLASEHGVPCHSDACIGGLVLPYLKRAGRDIPDFDLSVPGVRSVSVDLHKYGYAPKGASLLLYRDTAYRLGTFFTYSGWPGYPVVNTTLQSTKSAGPMAAAWTVSQMLGDEGFEEAARRAITATDSIIEAVRPIEGLRVVGDPDSTLIALAADGDSGVDPFVLADRMRTRGWFIQPQPACGDLPRTAHLTVQPSSLDTVEEFAAALALAAAECRDLPAASADPELLAAASAIDVDALDEASVAGLLAFAGLSGEAGIGLPEESAEIQALLEALPEALRDRLLAGFFDLIFRPTH